MTFELRKKSDGTGQKKRFCVNLQLSEPENAMINEEAIKLEVSRPDFIRVCIIEYFNNH